MAKNQAEQKLTILSADKDVEQLELADIVGGKTKWHGPFGKVW